MTGNSPDRLLSKKDFDKVKLFLMPADNKNKFLIYYDERILMKDNETFPIYKIGIYYIPYTELLSDDCMHLKVI